MLTPGTELLIYFGALVQQFDEPPDEGGHTRLEKVYAALYPTKPDFTSDDIRALPFSHFEPDT